LPDAQADPNGQSSTASVRVKTIIDASNAADNIMILPGDTISVPRADLVYAVGDVVKPGGFLLNEHESLSALQVVSLAEGLHKTAAADKARILRAVPGSPARTEIAVNLKQLMSGKGTDVQLQANDILFIPNSAAKSAGFRTLDAIVNAATGMAVYGRY
jgi:polysaccharide biosynthesis/export protein